MTTEHRYRKSFIGGLLGGSLGFLSGALVHSSVVSVVLFFVLGYVGYDLKGTAAILWCDTESCMQGVCIRFWQVPRADSLYGSMEPDCARGNAVPDAISHPHWIVAVP